MIKIIKEGQLAEIAKVINSTFEEYILGDATVIVNVRHADAVRFIKDLCYTDGNYVSDDTIESMGGCDITINEVKFKIITT